MNEHEQVPGGTGPVVETEDLWKLFKLGDEVVKALKGVSLKIHPGELVVIMGPSGSGKSTMLHLMGGLERPTKGEIYLEGQPLSGLTESQLSTMRHQAVGFIFQSYNLIPLLTATENVELPLVFDDVDSGQVRRDCVELLERVGLGHRLDHTPSRMSGGEQQRVAIARALIGKPRLLLADEPTANLDHKNGDAIVKLLTTLNHEMGMTTVISTHDRSVAEHASRVIEMRDGKVVSDSGSGDGAPADRLATA
ncbi:MAG TPA: ABC transporter ATP-binding protein [Solirubrobacterales bacterium]|nr:ABC transporter ATP-binding protein [Solirubrobacterales bacterium]HMU25988.1 ABC transporter ATP-binding protein [Solirubrobacterales bacterium]HMX70828.1 ABC transporter ATP-binding protein [Solirubrobacterales bacterium]HMY25061.1 ABC transporter ATP-binding protein [Solirubrobacterales bacterium]HNA24360.1 ABC transporter ATP-binding protein [Solirubrobacterales bacterium]